MGRYRNVETAKDEQSYEARVWWVFWIIALIVIIYTAWHQYRNYDLVHNGKCVEAQYYVYNEQEQARFKDENGNWVNKSLEGLNAIHDEDTVLVYYKDYMSLAEPKRDPKAWLYSYLIFVPLLAGTTWKLVTIYKKKPEEIIKDRWEP